VDRGEDPNPYAALIGRLILGQPVGDAEIDRLPDPETFRDALFLAEYGTFTSADLDAMDALLYALVTRLIKART
jgi:hypothetical protein